VDIWVINYLRKKSFNKKSMLKKLSILVFITIFILIIYFFDFGFVKGEITAYPLHCDKDKYINYQCIEKWLPLNPTSYKPNVSNQQVFSWTRATSFIEKYTKCPVLNRRNWTCKYDDGSGEFGFKNGQYWNYSRDDNLYHSHEFKYVPKFFYRLEEIKWLEL